MQVAARWSSIVTVARTNRVVDGDITLRHGIGLDPCWQAGAIWGYSGAKIKEALGTKIYKDVLKFREEAAQRKTQSTHEKDIGTFCADPICGELRQRNTGCYPLVLEPGTAPSLASEV